MRLQCSARLTSCQTCDRPYFDGQESSGGAACCCVLKHRGSFEDELLAQVLLQILSPFELRRLAAL